MKPQGIKIGFAGSHGTGKSTLLKELENRYPDMVILDNSIRNWIRECEAKGYNYKEIWARGTEKTQILFIMKHVNELISHNSSDYASARTPIDYLGYYKNLPSDELCELSEWYNDFAVEQTKNLFTHVFFTPIEFPLEDEELRYKENTRQGVEDEILTALINNDIDYTVLSGSIEERVEKMVGVLEENVYYRRF